MARFGQSFLASLTQPSYGKGLFELGGVIGGAPAAAAEKKRRDAMMEELMTGSPIQQARVLQKEGVRTGNIDLALKGQQLEKDTLQKGAAQGIEALITQVANPETTDAMVKQSRKTALQLARDNNVPESRVRQALDAAEKRRLTVNYETETTKINGLTIEANKSLSRGETREEFTEKHGEEYGYVYDTTKEQQELNEARVTTAKENAKNATFDYTDEELKDLGLNEGTIAKIKKLPSGTAKNTAVLNAVTSLARQQPNAALLNFYVDSELDTVMKENNFDYDDEDEVKQARAIAAKRVRETFLSTGGDPASMADAAVENKTKEEDEDIDMDAAIKALSSELLGGVDGS